MGMLCKVSSSSLKSLRLAPATDRPTGTPPLSTSKESLVPVLPRSTGEGPVFFPCQGGLGRRAVHTHPFPVDAPEGVVGRQALLPKAQEKAILHPLLKAVVGGGTGTKSSGRERVPLATRFARQRRSPPRTPDLASWAARRPAGECCRCTGKSGSISAQSSSVSPKQPPVLGMRLACGRRRAFFLAGEVFTHLYLTSPRCYSDRQ